MSNRSSESVILVHGLGGSRLDMWPLAKRLRRSKFDVINWGYRSLGNRIDGHARRLADKITTLELSDAVDTIHLVGHSMGGIIIRSMLAQNLLSVDPTKIGRIMMLAPPNGGSHVARRLAPWLNWLAPSLEELSDHPESYVNQLPVLRRSSTSRLAVVEATKDRVIDSSCVQLDGQTDFTRIEGHHGILTWYPETIQLVDRFLCHGEFPTSTSLDTTETADRTNNASKRPLCELS